MLYVSGIANGKMVIRGIYQFRSTYGAPLDLIFEKLKENNMVPDWYYLLNQIPPSKVSELKQAIIDVYGRDYLYNL